MKKAKLFLGMMMIAISMSLSLPVLASQLDANTIQEDIQPRTDIKEWLYKIVDGNLYKRLYNYSTGHWETDWIFVMSGVIEP